MKIFLFIVLFFSSSALHALTFNNGYNSFNCQLKDNNSIVEVSFRVRRLKNLGSDGNFFSLSYLLPSGESEGLYINGGGFKSTSQGCPDDIKSVDDLDDLNDSLEDCLDHSYNKKTNRYVSGQQRSMSSDGGEYYDFNSEYIFFDLKKMSGNFRSITGFSYPDLQGRSDISREFYNCVRN